MSYCRDVFHILFRQCFFHTLSVLFCFADEGTEYFCGCFRIIFREGGQGGEIQRFLLGMIFFGRCYMGSRISCGGYILSCDLEDGCKQFVYGERFVQATGKAM